MSAAVEGSYPVEDSYEEDDFEDDFESEDTSSVDSTPRRATEVVPPKQRSSRSSASSSLSSSRRSAAAAAVSKAAAAADASTSFDSSAAPPPAQHAEEVVAHRASTVSGHSATTSSRSSSSFSESHRSSHSASRVSSHRAPAAADAQDDAYAELGESGRRGDETAAAKGEEEEKDDRDELHADAINDGDERCADGTAADSKTAAATAAGPKSGRTKRGAGHGRRGDRDGHPTGRSAASSQRGTPAAATSEQRRVHRPEVPQNAEELEEMLRENARLRDELFEKNRNQYHATLSQSTKSGHGMSTAAATTTTAGGGGGAAAAGNHRDAAARLVQDSLLAHRTLQTLKLEQRDLTQRRDELKKLISQYRRASKYRELVEGVKQDILDYQEEHRDVQLEVRCNEKLLLLAEHMAESGVGDRRVQEEIRAQNALTQRRREHALRDADAAQRKHDAAAQRVDELKAELEKRREAAGNSSGGKSANLLAENRAKKDRIRELRARLQELESAGHASATSSQQRYRSQQSVRDDAEREYLQGRLAEMQRELAAAAARSNNPNTNANSTSNVQASSRNSANTSASNVGSRAPAAQESSASMQQQQQPPRRTPTSPPPPSSAHGSRKTTSPPPLHVVGDEAQDAPPAEPETHEIDVSAWLNAHPVAAVANPAETLRPTSALTHENTGEHHDHANAYNTSNSNEHHELYPTGSATAQQKVFIPPVPQPPYAQEPAPESVPLTVAHAAAPAAPARADETPAWLGGGVEDAPAAPGSSGYPVEEDADAPAEEEEVVDDNLDEAGEMEELDEPAPQHGASAAAAEAADAPKDDDGPDWLNF